MPMNLEARAAGRVDAHAAMSTGWAADACMNHENHANGVSQGHLCSTLGNQNDAPPLLCAPP